jgi:hypothetical protein
VTNHPNHPALIRPILIDSDGQRAFHNAICAKKFQCNNALAANSVHTKRNARGAKILVQKRAFRKLPSMQKALFHRAFLNFSDARTNECRVSHARAINFDFDRAMMQSCVASCAHTCFVRR